MSKETEKEKVALILVDIQHDFLENGSLAVPNSNSILEPVNQLIKQVKAYGGIVVATKDWHPQDHISFASNHPEKKIFETKEIEFDHTKVTQVMWPDHCVQGTFGAEISNAIDTSLIDVTVTKGKNRFVDSYSAFADNQYSEITSLAKTLYQHSIDTVIVVGLATDYCVKFTCLDAIKFGFKTVLVEECTKPVLQDQWYSTMAVLKAKGVVVRNYSDQFFS